MRKERIKSLKLDMTLLHRDFDLEAVRPQDVLQPAMVEVKLAGVMSIEAAERIKALAEDMLGVKVEEPIIARGGGRPGE